VNCRKTARAEDLNARRGVWFPARLQEQPDSRLRRFSYPCCCAIRTHPTGRDGLVLKNNSRCRFFFGDRQRTGVTPMRDIGYFSGGKQVPGTSGRTGDVFNPNTGEVQAKVALASKAEVEKAIANAQAAFPGWAATNPQRRARVMFKFLELIQAEYDDLARLLS